MRCGKILYGDKKMSNQSQEILKKVLGMPPIERAELVEKVFDSFNGSKEDIFDSQWAREAESRIDAFEKGKIKAVDAKKVIRNMKGPL